MTESRFYASLSPNFSRPRPSSAPHPHPTPELSPNSKVYFLDPASASSLGAACFYRAFGERMFLNIFRMRWSFSREVQQFSVVLSLFGRLFHSYL